MLEPLRHRGDHAGIAAQGQGGHDREPHRHGQPDRAQSEVVLAPPKIEGGHGVHRREHEVVAPQAARDRLDIIDHRQQHRSIPIEIR